jgi:methylglutaconyl-CoA hydratase
MIAFRTENRIARITLNRPDKRNALSPAMVDALLSAVQQAMSDDEARAIVLDAAGNVFSAGADLEALQTMQAWDEEAQKQDSLKLAGLYRLLYSGPKPVIGLVQGHALAGGCGLVSVCDWVFAVPSAQFAYTEVAIGFVPAMVSVFLCRKLGEGFARPLLLNSARISAEDALRYGLVYKLVEPLSLESIALEFVQHLIAQNSGDSIALTKGLLARNAGLDQAVANAIETNVEARLSEACRSGVSAFLSKEKLLW